MVELKKDPWVIGSNTLLVGGLIALMAFDKLTVEQFLVVAPLILVPSMIGRKKGPPPPDGPPGAPSDAPPPIVYPHDGSKGVFAVALALVGCASAASFTPEEKAAAAESAYTAEMLRCVDEASTLHESRECRKRVRARWEDGGAP